ncbi:hypothetical protein WJX72_012172 [[Myrmecia] bisecta]|uniref:ABC transporter domain-containing protein n=1 Tax=[Myrmecia] bisecta TaxID=41462 RepID=A0AAW1Q7D8_9CHLO
MPVPVSVTNPKGVGLQGAKASVLATEGPFARLVVKNAESGQQGMQAAAPTQDQPATSAAALDQSAVEVSNLGFSYPGIDGRPIPGFPPVVEGASFKLLPGQRCLLIGPNGAGKTTVLKILGGKHMVPKGSVRVLGQSPFHDTQLTGSGDLSYIGGNWERDIAFAGYSVPLQGDFSAASMINGIPDIDSKRRQRLIEVLDIDPDWRMHTVSDGQRRRVQICMGLLKPFKVLLLDEITVDLDVLGRADLMAFLRQECEDRHATIIYATHIFDGLESWPTHVLYLAHGKVQVFQPASEIPELQEGKLLELVDRWLRQEKAERKAKQAQQKAADMTDDGEALDMASWSNGWAPGRMTSSLRDSSNTVMRM